MGQDCFHNSNRCAVISSRDDWILLFVVATESYIVNQTDVVQAFLHWTLGQSGHCMMLIITSILLLATHVRLGWCSIFCVQSIVFFKDFNLDLFEVQAEENRLVQIKHANVAHTTWI